MTITRESSLKKGREYYSHHYNPFPINQLGRAHVRTRPSIQTAPYLSFSCLIQAGQNLVEGGTGAHAGLHLIWAGMVIPSNIDWLAFDGL